MNAAARRIQANLAAVGERIAAATRASGRKADSIRLVAVTKYVDAATTRLLVEAGCHDLGESRPQDLWRKAPELPDLAVRWHMVGHLQRNKLRRTLPLITLLHSLDNFELAADIDAQVRAAGGQAFESLLEVNLSGEATKHGWRPEELDAALEKLSPLENLRITGLMGMSGLDAVSDEVARQFATLRALADRLRPNAPANAPLGELSMGMSGDFEIAIREGATIVRIGSALVEGLDG